MLTIVNIEKLYKLLVGNWKVGKVVTLDSSYLIQLYKYNSMETMQVNIERTPIGEGDTALYELWFWSGSDKDPIHQTPVRRLLRKCDFELGPLYLIKNIENMMSL
jgi:hypothetical protein